MSSSNNNNNDHNRVETTGCLKSSVPSSPANIYVQPPVLPTAGQVKHHQHRHNVKSRYEFLQTLGRGTYGKVKLARHKDSNKYVAIKAIRKDKIGQLNMTHIRREMEIVSQIHHPNIIKIHEVFENQEKIVIVMEYAAGGELYDYISKKRHLDEEETKHIFRQIVSAVRYCHKQGIVHRDLKLENILLDKHNKIKIADFGLANRFDENSKLKTFCGSPLYASPEIVTGTPYNGPEVDSWSLGVLLYALVYGTMPFDSNNYPTLSQKITEGKYVQPAVPSNAQELIDWLLQVDPKKRATIDEVHGHRWLKLSKETIASSFLPNSPRIQYPHVVSVENSNNNRHQQQYIMQQQQQQTNNNNIIETPKSILKQPTIEVSSPPSPSFTSATTTPQPSTVISSTTSTPRQTPSSEAELEGQLAVVCGLHARDSLKLKNRALQTSVVAHKRRLLRAKRDRESGYYSSPERASQSLSSSSSGGPSTSPTSAGVSPQHDQALYIGGDESLKVNPTASMPLSVKLRPPRQLTPNPGQLVLPTLERLASGDGGSNERSPRPQSAYSDSSILSSDSFSLCSFTPCIIDQPATMTPPMPSHMMDGSTPSRPMSMPILPDTLPDPTPDELEHQHSGTLSPKSEQLLRGLERILMPNGRYRQHLNSAPPALGGSGVCSEFLTTASSNHHSSCYTGAAYVNSSGGGYNNSAHNFPTTTYHQSSRPSYVLPPPPSYHAGGYQNVCTTQQVQQHYYQPQQQPQQYNYVQSNMMAATVTTTSSNNNFGLPPPPSPQGYVHQGGYPVMNQQQQQEQQQQLTNEMIPSANNDNIYHHQFVSSSNNDDSPPPQYTSVMAASSPPSNKLLPTIEMSKNDWENPYKCPLGGAIRANLTADV